MDIRLVAVDLDGCLLNPELETESLAALNALEAEGIKWCVATGRAAGRCSGLRERLHPSAGWVMAHGGRVEHGVYSRTAPVAPNELAELIVLLEAEWPDAVMAVDRDEIIYRDPEYPLPHRIGRQSAVVDRDTMTVCGPDMIRIWGDRIDALPRALDASGLRLRCWDVGPEDYLELTAPIATKEAALRYLCDCLGLEASQVAAIGDGHSDAGMLLWSGRGVTLPWAHVAALGAADLVAEGGFRSALRLAVS